MEVRVKRAEFLAELAPMQGIVERRTTIPVLSHILLKTEGDRLHLAATDLDVSLTSWCSGEVKAEGGIAVQARKFLEIIRSLVGEEVDLLLEDERRLSIVAGRSRFKINGLAPEDFPTLPSVSEDSSIELPFSELKQMIGKVIFAVSTEESRFQLNGALLKLKESTLEIVATDGHPRDRRHRRPPSGSRGERPRRGERRRRRPGAAQGAPGASAFRRRRRDPVHAG